MRDGYFVGEGEGSWFEFCLFAFGASLLLSLWLALQWKYQMKVKWGKGVFFFWADLISHTLAHADKGIHPQEVPLFLRTDFVGEKTFVSRGSGYTARSGIEIWRLPSSFTCCTESDKPIQVVWAIKKHSEMPELPRFTANIVPRHWMTARLAHHFVLLNIVPGEPVPADLEKKGQAEVTPRPRWHLMGVTLGLAELRLHCLQSTYHMEGRAACQNTDTGTKQRIIAINPTQRAETEMSAKHVSWLDSSTHRTSG